MSTQIKTKIQNVLIKFLAGKYVSLEVDIELS